MSGPYADPDKHSKVTRPLESAAVRRLHAPSVAEDAGLTLQEVLEQVATPLGGDLWDIDGVVVEASASCGLWRFRPTGARRDALDVYHCLRCTRCAGGLAHPVTLPGRGYLLGPFHETCAKQVETEFQQQAVATLEHGKTTS